MINLEESLRLQDLTMVVNNPNLPSKIPEFIFSSGYARSGKDLLFKLFQEFYKSDIVQVSLALELKRELREFCIKNYNIDLNNLSDNEKSTIRPLLVEHGKIKRIMSNGKYWIDTLEKSLKLPPYNNSNLKKFCTDIRYKHYQFDELDWVFSMGGLLLHVTKYKLEDYQIIYNPAPNSEELINDPRIKEKAHFHIYWRDCGGYDAALEKYKNLLPLLGKYIIL